METDDPLQIPLREQLKEEEDSSLFAFVVVFAVLQYLDYLCS